MGTPVLPSVDSDTKQFTDGVRARVASNLRDGTTVEGAALVQAASPRTEQVRITAANLPKWTQKRQLAAFAQAPARILCVGDSTTAGVYSDSYTTATGSTNQGGPNSYPSRLAAALTARGIPAAVGMAIPGHGGNDDARWTGSAGQNYAGGNIGAGANAALTLTTTGHAITLTPNVKADTFIVYFYGDGGTGSFSGTATGGTATSVNTAAGASGIKKATIVAGAPSVSNSVTFTWSAGTSFILGVEFYDSTSPNIVRVLPAGVGGSQANQWVSSGSPTVFGGRAFIKAVAPDLTIISLGINDDAAGRTPAQVLADVQALVSDAQTSGDALIVSAFPHPSVSSLESVNAAFYGSTLPYVDLAWRYGRNMLAWGLMTVDQTHPNALGYGDAASVISRVL